MPSSASPRAKSTSPRLSETVKSARLICTPPGSVTSTALSSVVAIRTLLDYDLTRGRRVHPHGALFIRRHTPPLGLGLDAGRQGPPEEPGPRTAGRPAAAGGARSRVSG